MATMDRRNLLKRGGLLGLGLVGTGVARAAELCGVTPDQPEGPFYPVQDQLDTDTDLTFVQGGSATAEGQVVVVHGQVRSLHCEPVAGALVEIWQACHTGKYDHPQDPNDAQLDPHFQYWGRTHTDAQGRYRFRTILPGAYPAGGSWIRPPHIHFKVAAPGLRSLTTQMYWRGHPLNDDDRILRRLAPDLRERVEVEFAPDPENPDQHVGRFDVIVGPAGAPGLTPELD